MASIFLILVVFLFMVGQFLITEGYGVYRREQNMKTAVYKMANGWLLLLATAFILICLEHAEYWEPGWCKGISVAIMILTTLAFLDGEKCPVSAYVVQLTVSALFVWGVFWT